MIDAVAEVPLFHGDAFERSKDGPRLLGSRCRACDQVFHPRVSICFECLGSDLAILPLASIGTLECFTTVHMPAERIAAPYTVGYVTLPEGMRIFAPIDAAADVLTVGMTMHLAYFALGVGRPEAIAYCFVPESGMRAP